MKSAEEESSSCPSHSNIHLPLRCWDNCFCSKTPDPWEKMASVLKTKNPHNMWRAPASVDQLSRIVYSAALHKSTTVRAMNRSTGGRSTLTLQTQHLTHYSFIVLQFFSPSPFLSPSKRDLASSSTDSSADLSLSSWGHTFSPWYPGCVVPAFPLHQHN